VVSRGTDISDIISAMRVATLLVGIAARLLAQDPGIQGDVVKGESLIDRIRTKTSENIRRQPDYTCLDSLERHIRYRSGTDNWDRVRLEVAMVDGHEVFAWPGSDQFLYSDPGELIPGGTTGSGSFALHARNIFLSGIAVFSYMGEAPVENYPSVRYDYVVPRTADGSYNSYLAIDNQHALLGFHGSVYADPQSAEIRRVEVSLDDIPEEFNLAQVRETIEYARVTIGDHDFLLPSESELTITAPDRVHVNHTRFTNCRRFEARSVLSFPDSDGAADGAAGFTPAVSLKREIQLPSETDLNVVLLDDVDWKGAAAGDSIRGQLRDDVRSEGRVVIPKGAIARGKILEFGIRGERKHFAVRFTDLDWQGGHARLIARVIGMRQRGSSQAWAGSALGTIVYVPEVDPIVWTDFCLSLDGEAG
jgi:hypothetical protein